MPPCSPGAVGSLPGTSAREVAYQPGTSMNAAPRDGCCVVIL